MKREKMKLEDFFALGNGVKDARELMSRLIKLAEELPKKITIHLGEAIDHLEKFRSDAEDRMFLLHGGDPRMEKHGINVFYNLGVRVNRNNPEREGQSPLPPEDMNISLPSSRNGAEGTAQKGGPDGQDTPT